MVTEVAMVTMALIMAEEVVMMTIMTVTAAQKKVAEEELQLMI
jgi:hypothetical protein